MRLALILGAALLPLSLASVMIGAASLDWANIASDPQAFLILTVSRVPRTVAVILTGAALAVAGVVMQQIVRNRFVEPGTVGTAEGAALGLLAVTVLAPAAPIWAKMLVASLGALAATTIFLALIRRLPRARCCWCRWSGWCWRGCCRPASPSSAGRPTFCNMSASG